MSSIKRTDSTGFPLNIAVIGAGISGICTAYLLQKKHRVTLYEKNDYFGGHTHTVMIPDGPDRGTPVDTGFIVLNPRTYPNFIKFLDLLGVAISPTAMSFGYYCKPTGLYYATQGLNSLFAQRANIVNPKYWRFIYEIVRFLGQLRKSYLENRLESITLGEYIDKQGFHQEVVTQFILPMASAIWSGPGRQMMAFPLDIFARFYENHGLLSVRNHPPWYFVRGGSHTYVRAFLDAFLGRAVKQSPVRGIKRENGEITLHFKGGGQEIFDAVVVATHGDQALELLEDPDADEKRLLGTWTYSRNETWLHTDRSVMPPDTRAWACWNYTREMDSDHRSPVMVTYYMNRLQRLKTVRPYFVSLNPGKHISGKEVIQKMTYTHPRFSFDAFDTQTALSQINGRQNTYFCGSYFGYGFHEDGVNSALAVAKKFGIDL